MLFASPIFLFIFLPLFLLLYYLTPPNQVVKNAVALGGSILFFAWGEPLFVFFLLISTMLDYKLSLLITPQASLQETTKKFILAGAIIFNVVVLACSKYLNFIAGELTRFHVHLSLPSLPLFLGISFITFHKISYLVDSYKGRATPPRHFFDCALYIFLFPQLIAGPIIRYHDIGDQIHAREHTINGFLTGFFRFSVGLAKKIMLADPLGRIADQVFGFSMDEISPLLAWCGIIAYTLQIYFDFSGYSDMAIGLGRLIGFKFPENFDRPYISRSVTEFWRRWHISLSNWMRLYLYIPLGGNRVSVPRTYLNLWIVFLISGLWHGASWNFIAWGAYYGFFLSLERLASSNSLLKNIILPDSLKYTLTMLIVIVGWVFFRSPTLSYALAYIGTLFGLSHLATSLALPWGNVITNHGLFTLIIASMISMFALPEKWWQSPINIFRACWSGATASYGLKIMSLQFAITLSLLTLSIFALISSDYTPFLYFRF